MPKIRIAENNNLICKFDPDVHTYMCENIKLTSVTKIIKSYFPVFDSETISKNYALKHGLKQADVLKMWEDKRNKSAIFGKNCHDFAEKIFLKRKPYPKPQNKKEYLYFTYIFEYIKKLAQKYILIETEEILFSLNLKIAGTVDLLLFDPETKRIIIADWKTNEELKQENSFQSGLHGLAHLDDCNMNHYYLQLNMYKGLFILEDYYKDVLPVSEDKITLVIFHVTDKGVKYYKVPDMTDEIKYIFNNRLG